MVSCSHYSSMQTWQAQMIISSSASLASAHISWLASRLIMEKFDREAAQLGEKECQWTWDGTRWWNLSSDFKNLFCPRNGEITASKRRRRKTYKASGKLKDKRKTSMSLKIPFRWGEWRYSSASPSQRGWRNLELITFGGPRTTTTTTTTTGKAFDRKTFFFSRVIKDRIRLPSLVGPLCKRETF